MADITYVLQARPAYALHEADEAKSAQPEQPVQQRWLAARVQLQKNEIPVYGAHQGCPDLLMAMSNGSRL